LIRDAEKRSALKPRLQRLPADAPDRMRVWVINRPRLAQAKATPAKRAPLRVRVPKRLANPHPLVASARGILRAKGGVSWRKPHLDIAVDPAHLSRALRIMDALIKALERRGHSVTLIQRVDRFAPYQTPYRRATTHVRIGQEEVAFRLIERRRNNPSFASEPWSASRPRYLSTGRLRFEISHYVPDPKPRTSWSDGRRQRLEDVVGEMVEALEATGERARQWQVQQEKERRKREEEAEGRREEERQRALEQAKLEALEPQVADWVKSRQLREYVEMVRSRLNEIVDEAQRQELKDWLAWALAHASRLERWPPSGDVT
jgi:hypothetical protein